MLKLIQEVIELQRKTRQIEDSTKIQFETLSRKPESKDVESLRKQFLFLANGQHEMNKKVIQWFQIQLELIKKFAPSYAKRLENEVKQLEKSFNNHFRLKQYSIDNQNIVDRDDLMEMHQDVQKKFLILGEKIELARACIGGCLSLAWSYYQKKFDKELLVYEKNAKK